MSRQAHFPGGVYLPCCHPQQERSAQAMFNLGYAHEFGIGVQKDLQLARRFYNMAKHTQKDATIAVYIACGWLALHEAWEAAAPYVPAALQGFWSRALTVEPPYTTVLGPWGQAIQSALPTHALLQAEAGFGRLVEALHLKDLLSVFTYEGEEGDEGSDTTLLIGLIVILVIVMRARQQRAAARAAQAPPPPPQANLAGDQGQHQPEDDQAPGLGPG